MSEVRTRFAPSPTGYMHVGNLRTALYTYLLAKSMDGKFILRIEDTDQERYVEGSVDIIYKTLKKTGLIWDEGPDIGGPVGPYIQSERMGIFFEFAQKLVESGNAYYCFCTKERLDEVRKIQSISNIAPKYDGHCRNIPLEEAKKRIEAGEPYVIRQKVPTSGTTTFDDLVFGQITVENITLDDQVLIKQDGMPTYNFANVVDDHAMGITHIIRGSEYLSSTPKYNLLYLAFGWEIPVYIHVSPVMKNQTEKLSKRNGDASYEDLIEKGYISEAIINYIALLGWSAGGEQEIFTLAEMINLFNIEGISKSPAIFDIQKLNWVNGEYIRAFSPEKFLKIALPWIKKMVTRTDVDYNMIAHVLQQRTEVLGDIPEQLDFIDTLPDYDTELFISKKMKTTKESCLEMLKEFVAIFEAITDFNFDNIHTTLFEFIAKKEIKNGFALWPLRIAVSGKQFTPGGGIEIAAILGKDDTIKRLKIAVEKLSKELI